MWNDVVDLRDFYDSRLGQVTRHLIRRRVRALWPDLRGQSLLGLGYATPYLRQYRDEAERVLAIMPAGQGVLAWPPEGPNAVALAEETELPLPDMSVDRVLLVHGLECGEQVRDMLREVWRVMSGSGRLLIVVPNRRGIWARTDRTPFGQGLPYSPPQLSVSCAITSSRRSSRARRCSFRRPAPPRCCTAAAWERIGGRWCRALPASC
jgi:SAM-dependent methyltransferase